MAIDKMRDEEYSRLDELLISHIDDCLSLDEAHGFFSAMLVAQFNLSDKQCVQWILGDAVFEKSAQKELIILLPKMFAEIQSELQNPQDFDILVVETEFQGETIEVYEGWCYGFMLAVSQTSDCWQSLGKNEQTILSPIAKLALLITDESLEMEDDEYDMLVELLPGTVLALNSFFTKNKMN